MIFKDVGEEETDFILKFVNRNSAVKKIWTKELRQLDPSTYRPDFIIELDDENLIIEFQSTDTDDDFSQRALVYVVIANLRKKNDKEVNLAVVSTSEESKVVRYRINKSSIFGYEVIGNNTFDGEKIINEIEDKFERSDEISREETICFSLAPLMTKDGNLEKNLLKAVDILIKLEEIPDSTKNLCYGIEWLLVDKYVKDDKLRTLLQDVLGEKMTAIYEYGERKEKKGKKQGLEQGLEQGKKEVIISLYESGMSTEEISHRTNISIDVIEKFLGQH